MTALPTPPSITVETVAGLAAAGGGALYVLVHAAQVPSFVIELLIGLGSGSGFWSMLGAVLLGALGVAMTVHGRRRLRAHVAFAARVEAIRRRRESREGGTSAGIGPTHAAPIRFPQATFADDRS